MENKTFELLEKMYSEFVGFREDTNQKFDKLEGKFDKLEGKVENIERKVDKNTLMLESLTTKVETIAEVQQNHIE